MIEIKNLSKNYGKNQVLNGLNMKLNSREIICLVGPNGSGKTTLLKIILSLIKNYKGNVISKSNISKKGIIEDPGFFSFMTGRENLIYLMNGKKNENWNYYISRLEMCDYIDQKVAKYSRGMKQRLALLYVLLYDADLIVLDEPTNGLDPKGMELFKTLMLEEKEKGKGIIISSHLINDIYFCDRVLLLYNGRIHKELGKTDLDSKQIIFTFSTVENAKAASSFLKVPYQLKDYKLQLNISKKEIPYYVKQLSNYEITSVYEKQLSLIDYYLLEIEGEEDVS